MVNQASKSQFQVNWCKDESSLREVLKLRKLCFPAIKEYLSDADLLAHHLVIRNDEQQIIGAYRVTLSTQTERFETEDDFLIEEFKKKPGIKVELAWACVHPDYRDGRVIHLLWRALSEFFKEHQVRYVFGLASVTTEGSEQVLDIMSYLKNENYVIAQNSITARHGYFSENAVVLERAHTQPLRRRLLPSLLRAYLMAGALVCLQPVFDADLDCYDFMTVLDVDSAAPAVATHFNFK
ncbi:GNAT family N-acetyltransferase [Bdellovibrio sp. NC01]|uniref:GNAT family N-acetyltransferase n=1 Tax=Bdellovibrio sp. NC01 TaxID=2220073 RepID=UPI001159C6CF|nr:GNAT family N-acyltransferase [Bdellovibrio sp. NC01]QDK37469.1 hypothetical protein DOE51_07660 [Bdellovibrio sp. NC01]